MDSDHHPLVHQHLNPNSQSDHQRHPQRVGLPVASVNPRHFASVGNNSRLSRNRGTVFAPHITHHTRILSRSLHFIGIPRSEEFDLSLIHNQPHLYFLQFAGSLVGPEPLHVLFQRAFQFWSHRVGVILGPRLTVWQLASMLQQCIAPGPPANTPSPRKTPQKRFSELRRSPACRRLTPAGHRSVLPSASSPPIREIQGPQNPSSPSNI